MIGLDIVTHGYGGSITGLDIATHGYVNVAMVISEVVIDNFKAVIEFLNSNKIIKSLTSNKTIDSLNEDKIIKFIG
jgi:hypothetical protein